MMTRDFCHVGENYKHFPLVLLVEQETQETPWESLVIREERKFESCTSMMSSKAHTLQLP